MLAWYISRIFDDDALAEEFSRASRARAAQTHDRAANLNTLVGIYDSIS